MKYVLHLPSNTSVKSIIVFHGVWLHMEAKNQL